VLLKLNDKGRLMPTLLRLNDEVRFMLVELIKVLGGMAIIGPMAYAATSVAMPSTPTLHVISLDSVLPLSFTLTCL
jgi:hypothetical protein